MKLIYQTYPDVTLATNVFVGMPVILQLDDLPLISVVRAESLGFTTEMPIYHADGTYLAKVNGTRAFCTPAGEKAGIKMRDLPNMTVCELDGKTVFEITHQAGDAFRIDAELSTPSGYLVKMSDSADLFKTNGDQIQLSGLRLSGCEFEGGRIGLFLKSSGEILFNCF